MSDDHSRRFDESWMRAEIDRTRKMAKALVLDFVLEPEQDKIEKVVAAAEYLGIDLGQPAMQHFTDEEIWGRYYDRLLAWAEIEKSNGGKS